MTILTDWRLEIGVDDVLRGQGADPAVVHARKPALERAARRAIEEGMTLLHPVAVLAEVDIRESRHEKIILEDGHVLSGALVARHLAGATRVAAVVCSIGEELEKASAAAFANDLLFALALDGLGNAAVEQLAEQVCTSLCGSHDKDEFDVSTPISPGSPEWQVDVGQPQIFALLEAGEAGIRLTPSWMMIPKKSVSFVVGMGVNMAQTNLCTLCSLKETCRYQHA